MLDFVFELLFQVIFEAVAEVLVNVGFRGTAALVRSRLFRYASSIAVGFAGGALWGDYLAGQGAGHRPRLFWVSLGVATAAALLALWRWQRERGGDIGPDREEWHTFALPWRWPPVRLVAFSLMNVAIAAGIAVGYTPPMPG